MEKQFKLRKNYQFNYVYKNGKSVGDGRIVIVFCSNKNKKPKIGFSITKKYGNAVKRNRIRRQLKEIVVKRFETLRCEYNYIFMPRINLTDYKFADLEKSVDSLLSKIKSVN